MPLGPVESAVRSHTGPIGLEGHLSASNDSDITSPHNLDAERAVLGGILIDNSQFTTVAAVISELDFFRDGHALIFRLVAELIAGGKPADLVTLYAVIEQRGLIEDTGGAAYISRLLDGVPKSTNVLAYAEIVREMSTRRGAIACGQRLVASAAAEDLVEALGEAERALHLLYVRDQRPTCRLLDDVAIMSEPFPPMLVAGRVPAACLMALVGQPDRFKTFVAADLGLSVAHGERWLGASVQQRGPVVYVAAEGAPGIAKRVAAWKSHRGIPLDQRVGFHVLPEAVDLRDPNAVQRFLSDAASVSPVLVVFDTLNRCMLGGDENGSTDMGAVIAAADRLRSELGATICFVHHTRKSGDDPRGHSSFRGALDTMLTVGRAVDRARGRVVLSCERQKDLAPFDPISIEMLNAAESLVPVVLPVTQAGPCIKLTPTKEALLREVCAADPTRGITRGELAKRVPGASPDQLYRAVSQFIRDGLAESLNGSKHAGYEQLVATDRARQVLSGG